MDQIAKEKAGSNTHFFICVILEVEGAQGYDITAVGLLTDIVYVIGRT